MALAALQGRTRPYPARGAGEALGHSRGRSLQLKPSVILQFQVPGLHAPAGLQELPAPPDTAARVRGGTQPAKGALGHGENPNTQQNATLCVGTGPTRSPRATERPQSPSKCVQMLPVSVCIRKMLLKQARKDGMGGRCPCRR